MMEGITSSREIKGSEWVINVYVQDKTLNYPQDNQNALTLALKLEMGITGLRTQVSKSGKDPARSPTAGWWEKAVQEIKQKYNFV